MNWNLERKNVLKYIETDNIHQLILSESKKKKEKSIEDYGSCVYLYTREKNTFTAKGNGDFLQYPVK